VSTHLLRLRDPVDDVGSSTNIPKPSLPPDPKDEIEEANLLHQAMMASEDNRISDARAALEKVLAVDPKSPIALRQISELELNAGDYTRLLNISKLLWKFDWTRGRLHSTRDRR
jgi:hypothetical protein